MTSSLARKWALDVAPYIAGIDPAAATGWVRFKGITDFSRQIAPTMQDVTDYDNDGWSDSEKTLQTFTITVKARRPYDGGVYDPGQETAHAAETGFGDNSRVFVRYYDRNGGEARAGRATVEWSQSKTGVADVEEITVTFNGSGKIVNITNPATASAVPSIAAVSPAGKGAGQAVTITGAGFLGTVANGVKFGGTASGSPATVTGNTAATDFTVVSDSLITAVLPTGTAGATLVVVTNMTGTSVPFTYTRAV